MPRLPPLDKLPLAARKNLRDEWQNNQAEFEQRLSKATGVEWKIDIDSLAVVPYGAADSWARESPGSMISTYVDDAIRSLEGDPKYHDQIKKLASAHILTMDVDEENTFDACGAKFTGEGKLAIVFGADRLGSNTSDAFWHKNLEKGISLAPTTEVLSFYARKGIHEDYEPDIAGVQSDLKEIVQKDIILNPNFEEVYTKLKQTKNGTDFDQYIGPFILNYFQGLVKVLKWRKFDSDDMLQEALSDALEKGEVHFRIVDTVAGSYGEAVFEDGILFLQTSPDKWGSNIDDISDNIIDLL